MDDHFESLGTQEDLALDNLTDREDTSDTSV